MTQYKRDFRHVLQKVKHDTFNRGEHLVLLGFSEVVQNHRSDIVVESLLLLERPAFNSHTQARPVKPSLSADSVFDIFEGKRLEHLPSNLAAVRPGDFWIGIDYFKESRGVEGSVDVVLTGEVCGHVLCANTPQLPAGVRPM